MKKELYPDFSILVADDEQIIIEIVVDYLANAGFTNVLSTTDSLEIAGLMASNDIGLILLDLSMPDLSGEDVLKDTTENHPETAVIIISGNQDIDRAVGCMKSGAADYVSKPFNETLLISAVRKVVASRELFGVNTSIAESLFNAKYIHPVAFRSITTCNNQIENAMRYVAAIANTPHSVLISGETGTGKDLFSRAIHEVSERKGAYVTVNIAGLDDTFFSDTLFGHKSGAFTGAVSNLAGLLEKANRGTILLDEIGDLSQASQIKLLRLLETHEYYPLGSDELKRTSAKILVATNKDLETECREGRFRKDLYYRLRSHHLKLPSLRERKNDIPLLAVYLLAQYEKESGIPRKIGKESLAVLSRHDFPGNIRELKAVIIDAASRSESEKIPSSLFSTILGFTEAPSVEPSEDSFQFPDRLPTIRAMTELLVAEALKRSNGHQAVAALMLGISPQALSKRLKG